MVSKHVPMAAGLVRLAAKHVMDRSAAVRQGRAARMPIPPPGLFVAVDRSLHAL